MAEDMTTAGTTSAKRESAPSLPAWRKKYGGLDAVEARKLKQLEDENRRLKAMVANLAFDQQILQAALARKR